MFNKMKYALSAMAVFCVLLFAGCGAVVDTELTADENFAGKRVMTLTLSNEDIKDNIPGGAAAIEKTVKKYIPKELTYTKSSDSDSLKYVFTLEFSDIEDYRTKAAAIFAANPDNKKEIDIQYENISSPFKMSASFKENFTSIEMMGWLTYGVRTDKISTYSTESDWYETGSTKFVWNGKEYTPGSTISMSDSEYNCADSVFVETRLPINGTADRKIGFVFSGSIADALKEKGTVLDDYFSAFAGGNVLYRSEPSDDGSDTVTCIIEMQGLSYEEIAKKTAQVLLDDNISFAVDVRRSDNKNGQLEIAVSEKLDASAYLKQSSGYLRSSCYLPEGINAAYSESDTVSPDRRTDDDGITYFTYSPGYYGEDISTMTFSWEPQFENCTVKLGFSGDKVRLSMTMNADSSMYETALQLLKEKVENAVDSAAGMSFAESESDGMVRYEVRLAEKDAKDVSENYINFISYYTGKTPACKITMEEAGNGTPFKKQTLYSAKINVSPLAGKEPVEFIFDKPFGSSVYFIGNTAGIEDGEPVYVNDIINVTILTEQVNVIGVILTITAAILFVAFAVTVLANLKTWVSAGKSAAKDAAAKAAASRPAPAKNTAPAGVSLDKNVPAEQNTQEEEDELI